MKNWPSLLYLLAALGVPVYQLLFGEKREPAPGYRLTKEEVKTQAPPVPTSVAPPPRETESEFV